MAKVKGTVEVTTTDESVLEGIAFRVNGNDKDILFLVESPDTNRILCVRGDSNQDKGTFVGCVDDLFNILREYFKSKEAL